MNQDLSHVITGKLLVEQYNFDEDVISYGDEQVECWARIYLEDVFFLAEPTEMTHEVYYDTPLSIRVYISPKDALAQRFTVIKDARELARVIRVLTKVSLQV